MKGRTDGRTDVCSYVRTYVRTVDDVMAIKPNFLASLLKNSGNYYLILLLSVSGSASLIGNHKFDSVQNTMNLFPSVFWSLPTTNCVHSS